MAYCNKNTDILRLRKIFILDLITDIPNIEQLTDDEWELHLKRYQDTNF